MSNDKLIEIPHDKLSALRDKYLIDWPNNIIGYYTIDNFIRWLQKEPKIKNLKFYSLNGDWSDGTYLIIDRYQLFINTLNKSLGRLTRALQLLDWTNGFKISSFYERYREIVRKVVEEKNLKIEFDSLTVLYYMPRTEAKNIEIDCPSNIILKSMSENDTEIADELWPNRHEGSLFFLRRLIKWNPNIGAYTKDGELVAWSFRLQAGPLGALQVKESHKRQGLGSLVTKAMAKILSDMDHDTFALVSDENWPSRKMFEKLGFKAIDNVIWLRTYPTIPFHWKDDDEEK